MASTVSNGTHLPHANIKHAHHNPPTRHHHPSRSDYDTANPVEVRKYLKTYGLTPPGIDTFEKQAQRCELHRVSIVLLARMTS